MTFAGNDLEESKWYLELRNKIIGYRPSLEYELEKSVKEEVIQPGQAIPGTISIFDEVKKAEIRANIRSSIIDFSSGEASIENIEKEKADIIQNSLKVIKQEINCQVAAIFLITKDGLLRRSGLLGVDKYGLPLEHSWAEGEVYEVGKSFTGSIFQTDQPRKDRYAEIRYTNKLEHLELDPIYKQQYLEKIGVLQEAIAVPLNGRNRTYGVVRVLNKKNGFSKEDVRKLAALADFTATSLSNFRRDVQNSIIRYLSCLLIKSHSDARATYQEIADLLAKNPETPFKACIIRIKSESGELFHMKSISCWKGVDNGLRKDEPILLKGTRLPEEVIKTGKRLIVGNIRSEGHIIKFTNKEWILDNELDSYGCFPLIVKGEVIGTLSLYTGYDYEFHPDAIIFIQHVADSIASFVYRVKSDRYFRTIQHLQNDYAAKTSVSDKQGQHEIDDRIKILRRKKAKLQPIENKQVRLHKSHRERKKEIISNPAIQNSLVRIALVLLIWAYLFLRLGISSQLNVWLQSTILLSILLYVFLEIVVSSGFLQKSKANE